VALLLKAILAMYDKLHYDNCMNIHTLRVNPHKKFTNHDYDELVNTSSTTIDVVSFDMVQLSSKVTFVRVPDTFCTRSEWVSHLAKSVAVNIKLFLLQFYRKICACMDTSCARSGRILQTFQTRANITLELSCTVWSNTITRMQCTICVLKGPHGVKI